LVAGVAVAEVLETVAPGLVALKWPNDIWLSGRKAGGIIAEAITEQNFHPSPLPQVNVASTGLRYVLLGIGLNLNLAARDIPSELQGKATSVLIATGQACDRVQLVAKLLSTLEIHYREAEASGFAAVRTAYEHYFALNGRRVTVVEGRARISGVVHGIDQDGALILENENGRTRILTGDVSLEGAYD
jgi:BirA family transcriptional regulator, biotin operon repressor / biotin---[acetyl-CoA-carboxylase] ligase